MKANLRRLMVIPVAGILLSLSSFSIIQENKDVFICKGKYSKKYHYNKSCRGLNNCSTKIYKVSLEKAKSLKRTLCAWED